jgi:phosphoglycerate kinase
MSAYFCITDEEMDLTGKTLIVRVDFNSPLDTDQQRAVLKGTRRIDDHLKKTIAPLFNLKRPPKNIVLLAHQGRLGHTDCTTLRPHFEYCRTALQPEDIKMFYVWEELTDKEVLDLGKNAVASHTVLQRISRLRERTVLLLENVRFADEVGERAEEARIASFAERPLIRMLAEVPDRVMVLDGFSVAHRCHASVVGLANIGVLYAGPIMAREIEQLSQALIKPEPPMLLIVGGAKVDDSLRSIDRFLSSGMAHEVLAGGLVGLLFLHAQGSKFNESTLNNLRKATASLTDATTLARKILRDYGKGQIKIPVDVAIAPRHGLLNDRQTLRVNDDLTTPKYEIGDIGVETIAQFNHEIARARTIIMNGPMGRYESMCFALGTQEVLRYIGLVAHDKGAHALVGGGDTGAALGGLEREYASNIKECSSGKAFLQVLASGDMESLPGVRALARRGHIENFASASVCA